MLGERRPCTDLRSSSPFGLVTVWDVLGVVTDFGQTD